MNHSGTPIFSSRFLLLFISISTIVLSSMEGQPWRSTLYPRDWTPPTEALFDTDAFIQDFSYAGYHRGEIPLPDEIPGSFINVTEEPYNADPTGETDSTVAIQAAINLIGLQGGGVVYLPEGTYRVSPGTKSASLTISRNGTVLRGAGTDKTYIFNSESNMRMKAVIEIKPVSGGNWNSGLDTVMITGDILTPTNLIPVESVESYSAGDWIVIRNSVTDAWAVEHNEPEWTGESANNRLRGLAFFRQVTAIDTAHKTIEIDVPVRYALKIRDKARIYKATTMVTEVGVEDLSIANQQSMNPDGWLDPDGTLYNNAHSNEAFGGYETHASFLIKFVGVLNGWLRNVNSFNPESNPSGAHMLSNGVLIEECRGVTVYNVHLKNAQYGGGGGNGYAFRIQANETLLKECSAETFRHGFVVSYMRSSGNVIHRCHDADTGHVTSINGRAESGSSGSDFHMWFSPSCLIDQMTMDDSYYSILHRRGVGSISHGTVSAHTVVWNLEVNSTIRDYAVATSQSRYGYVIGTSGDTPRVRYQQPDDYAFRYDTTGKRTAPKDIVEGEGLGEFLEPQSLYLDQLEKRLGQLEKIEVH